MNDDLIGFFNSVPRQQILDSLSRLVALYQERDFPPHVTVSLRKLSNSECAWPGKPWARGAKHLKYLHVSDLESIVSVSFKAGVFATLGLMFRQHRGTCIGNQISPVLSSLPVIQRESCLQRERAQFLTSSRFFDTQQAELFICRYVDNRLLLADVSILEHQCLRDFRNLSLDGGTIQLEEVTNHQFLGFRLDVANRTVTYMQPDKVWCIRNPRSAGSWSSRVSGFLSQKALITQYAWPPSQRQGQVQSSVGCTVQRISGRGSALNTGPLHCILFAWVPAHGACFKPAARSNMFSSTAWPEPLLSTGSAQHSSIAFYSDWIAMSSYVFQFFCGPEGIALANPGGARARPALAAPPPRTRVEFVSEEPPQPAARLRPARGPEAHRATERRDRRGPLRAIGADTAAERLTTPAPRRPAASWAMDASATTKARSS